MKTIEELGISPEPWITWHSNVNRVKDSRGFAVADCDYENSEDLANALLISAAPEMYKCMYDIVKSYNDCKPMSVVPNLIKRAEKILSKANGEREVAK